MEPIIHGIILAFGLILPLGVQNVFVFTQGASQPSLTRALPATITAAICDTFLILLAVFGLSIIVLQFDWLRVILMVAGTLFLLYMGYSIWNSKPTINEDKKALPARQQILFALSVSLLNPHAILDIVGVIGVNAMKYSGIQQISFTAACIFVSWIWFLGLSITGSLVKKIDGSGNLLFLFNKLSALFIWGTAIYVAIGLF